MMSHVTCHYVLFNDKNSMYIIEPFLPLSSELLSVSEGYRCVYILLTSVVVSMSYQLSKTNNNNCI